MEGLGKIISLCPLKPPNTALVPCWMQHTHFCIEKSAGMGEGDRSWMFVHLHYLNSHLAITEGFFSGREECHLSSLWWY